MIEGTEDRMAEWRNKGVDGKVGLMMGRLVLGVKEKVLVKVNMVVMENVLKW